MEWTERDKIEYGNFKYIRLFSDGDNDLKIVPEASKEKTEKSHSPSTRKCGSRSCYK
jgi:hypothetical protein